MCFDVRGGRRLGVYCLSRFYFKGIAMNQSRLRVAMLLPAVLLIATSLRAQSDLGSIQGVVKDPSSSVVPNASVTVKNQQTGLERQAKTNDGGVYTVTNFRRESTALPWKPPVLKNSKA